MSEVLQDFVKKILLVILWALTMVVAGELGYSLATRNPAPSAARVVTVVVTSAPSHLSVQTAPPVVVVVTATPEPPTPTPQPSPTTLPTETSTATPEPSVIPAEIPIASPTAPAAATAPPATQTPYVVVLIVTPIASPTPELTATSEPFKYPAPRLLGPPNGWDTGGVEHPPTLQWESVGHLDYGEYYAVTIRRVWHGEVSFQGSDWITETEFVPYAPIVFKTADDDNYYWWVTLMRQTGVREDGGKIGVPISPETEHRFFRWR